MASYGDGPLVGELAAAAEQAHGGYREMARYLLEDYAPRASERDAVGAERYAVAARISLGPMGLDGLSEALATAGSGSG